MSSDPFEWMRQAACRGSSPEVFFPARGQTIDLRAAQAICAICPVRDECLDYALEEKIREGVWGGVSERQRRKMRPKTVERSCEVCHRTFQAISRKHVLCSDPCRREVSRERARSRTEAQSSRPCTVCGLSVTHRDKQGVCQSWTCQRVAKRRALAADTADPWTVTDGLEAS